MHEHDVVKGKKKMEEENDEPRPPLVLYSDVGECRVIGAIGYGEGGRVVYKAEYKVDDKFRRFVSMIYVKESDSEAYQNLRSQTSDSYQCTWDHGDPYPGLHSPLMLLDWLPIRSKGYYCVASPSSSFSTSCSPRSGASGTYKIRTNAHLSTVRLVRHTYSFIT